MTKAKPPSARAKPSAMHAIFHRIETGGERIWRMADFSDLPPAAVAQSLSRLTRDGKIQRLSKGTYYRPRESVFGKTRPNPRAVSDIAAKNSALFPSGIAAANRLGFTTQAAPRSELSTSSASVPRKLLEPDIIVHTRRPEAWKRLAIDEAALLEFIRRGGRDSELTPAETVQRMKKIIITMKAFRKLMEAAPSEPPRVRAILGALGEGAGAEKKDIASLRRSLNPLSKFDFGVFAALPNARAWQAKALP